MKWSDLMSSREAILLLGVCVVALVVIFGFVALIEIRFAGSDARQNVFSGRIQSNADRIELVEKKIGTDVWDGPKRRAWLLKLKLANPQLIIPDQDEQ